MTHSRTPSACWNTLDDLPEGDDVISEEEMSAHVEHASPDYLAELDLCPDCLDAVRILVENTTTKGAL